MMNNKKQNLLDILASGGATIVFTKADGSERILRGTRNFTDIPVSMYPKQESMPSANENIIRVFDLDQCQWRSFNFESLISYTYTDDGKLMSWLRVNYE